MKEKDNIQNRKKKFQSKDPYKEVISKIYRQLRQLKSKIKQKYPIGNGPKISMDIS